MPSFHFPSKAPSFTDNLKWQYLEFDEGICIQPMFWTNVFDFSIELHISWGLLFAANAKLKYFIYQPETKQDSLDVWIMERM